MILVEYYRSLNQFVEDIFMPTSLLAIKMSTRRFHSKVASGYCFNLSYMKGDNDYKINNEINICSQIRSYL